MLRVTPVHKALYSVLHSIKMKSKRNTYFLLAAVLGIWGLIAYRFFAYAAPDGNESKPFASTAGPLPDFKKDTTAFNVSYRDPFLGTFYSEERNKPADRRPVNTKIKPAAEELVWPAIVYKGLVSDSKDRQKIFMLGINGKTVLLRGKGTEQGVTVLSGDRNSVTLGYKGKTNKVLISR